MSRHRDRAGLREVREEVPRDEAPGPAESYPMQGITRAALITVAGIGMVEQGYFSGFILEGIGLLFLASLFFPEKCGGIVRRRPALAAVPFPLRPAPGDRDALPEGIFALASAVGCIGVLISDIKRPVIMAIGLLLETLAYAVLCPLFYTLSEARSARIAALPVEARNVFPFSHEEMETLVFSLGSFVFSATGSSFMTWGAKHWGTFMELMGCLLVFIHAESHFRQEGAVRRLQEELALSFRRISERPRPVQPPAPAPAAPL